MGLNCQAGNLLNAIEASKQRGPAALLTGLGIEHVGSVAARRLINHFGSLTALQSASEADFAAVRDIGAITARSLSTWLERPESRELLRRLEELGVETRADSIMAEQRAFARTKVRSDRDFAELDARRGVGGD
ncbi:MAG: helix-hairpin-helix domain-containing protein [Saccharofermentanales bacterium]